MKKHAVKNQNGSSRMDTVLKMLLIAFIALLAFSSGVYFGKQLSDSDYQLKALESDFHGGEQAKTEGEDAGEEAHTAKNEGAKEESIREEDIAALSEKAVANEKHEAAAEAPKAEAHEAAREVAEAPKAEAHETHEAPAKVAAHETHAAPAKVAAKVPEHAAAAPKRAVAAVSGKPDLSAAAKAAQRVASNAAPVESPKPQAESRVPSSLPKVVGTSQDVEFTVQVASYPTAEAAKDHAEELVKKGFPAFPVEANVGGKVWYRVSVGSFRSQKEAVVYRSQLLKQTGVATAIVQKITR